MYPKNVPKMYLFLVWVGFKFLAIILFEILNLQNCNVKFQTFHRAITKKNEERDNKQCLLDTPRRVTVNNKRFISNVKSQRKNMHIYKSHWHY